MQTMMRLIMVCGAMLLWTTTVAAVLADAVPDKDLLFYASFDKGVNADVAKGEGKGEGKGMVEGRPSSYLVEGISGKAVLVNGGKTELKYKLPGNLNPAQGTVSFWAFTRDCDLNDNFFHVFFEAFESKNMLVFYKFFSVPNDIQFVYKPVVAEPRHFKTSTGEFEWPRRQWHHLAIAWTSETITIYLDGAKRPSVRIDTPMTDLGQFFFVGASHNRWGHLALAPDTVIDELRIYGRGLEDGEVQQLAKQFDLAAANAAAQASAPPAAARAAIPSSAWAIQKTAKPPQIDGTLDKGEWDDAVALAGLMSLELKRFSRPQARFFVTYDDQNLYIALDSPAVEGAPVQGRVSEGRDDGDIAVGDAMEVYLDPDRTGVTENAIQFLGSAAGGLFDRKGNDVKWNADWQYKVKTQNNHWTAELSVPFASLGRKAPKPGETWGMNLCRNFSGEQKWTSLVPGIYGEAKRFIPVRFDAGGTAVQAPVLAGFDQANAVFTWRLRNTGASGKSLRVFSRFYSPDGVIVNQQENEQLLIDAKAEQTQRFDLKEVATHLRSGETYYYELAVQEGRAGSEVYQSVTPFKYVEAMAVAKISPAQLAAERAKMEAPWKNNKLGIDHSVPAPWTPVSVSDKGQVGVWGRTYDLSAGGLPAGIVTRQRAILAEPVRLLLKSGAETADVAKLPVAVGEKQPDIVELTAAGRQAGLDVTLRTRIEFDGMIRYDLTLTPANPGAKLGQLALEIPLKGEAAIYTHSFLEKWQSSFSGRLPEGELKLPFRRQVWIGDEDLGLAWFAPSQKNWKNSGTAISGRRQGDRYVLRIDFVNEEKTLDKPATWTFGLMATPVKPRPEGWRRYQDLRMSLHPVAGAKPWNSIWRYEVAFSSLIPARPDAFDKKIKELKAAGDITMAYASPNFIGKNPLDADKTAAAGYNEEFYLEGVSDLYRLFYPLWTSIPQNDRGNHAAVCPTSEWNDFAVWAIQQLISRHGIQGMYFDNCFVNRCSNEQHGCGYFDDAGVSQAEFPIFSQRELKKRVYKLFQAAHKADGRETLIVDHTSALLDAPLLSFCDIAFDGEQVVLGPTDDYYEFFSQDQIRTEFTCWQWGYIPLMMAMFKTDLNRVQQEPAATEQFIGIGLLHDIPTDLLWTNIQARNQYFALMHEFRLVEARFTPYWHSPIQSPNPLVKVSLFQNPGEALLIVGNQTPKKQQVELALDAAKLGLKKLPEKAEDLYHDGEFPIRNGKVIVDLERYNFRALRVKE